jgi:hypothetical protein
MLNILRLVIIASACSLVPLRAETIIFNYSGDGTGTFDGTAFTDAPFTLVFTGDSPSTFTFAMDVTGVLTVQGFPTETLTNIEQMVYEPSLPDPYNQNANLFATGDLVSLGPPNGLYSGGTVGSYWNAWSDASPTNVGPVPFELWESPPVYYQTDLGTFELDGGSGVLTVTATPEPSQISITALAMFAVIGFRKLRGSPR